MACMYCGTFSSIERNQVTPLTRKWVPVEMITFNEKPVSERQILNVFSHSRFLHLIEIYKKIVYEYMTCR